MSKVNIGAAHFRRSKILKLLNQGNHNGASEQFAAWGNITSPVTGRLIPSPGLANRRNLERELFLNGTYQ